MIELRRVIPNRVTKPTSEPSERLPPVSSAAATPPTSAKGRLAEHQQQIAAAAGDHGQQQNDAQSGQQRVHQQFVARLRLRLDRAGELHVAARRELQLRDALAGLVHKRLHRAALHVAGDGLHAARALVQDGVASRGLVDVGDLLQRHEVSVGAAQRQCADFG